MSLLQWQLTSACARFQNCELLFDITRFFSIGYISEVCSNNKLPPFIYCLPLQNWILLSKTFWYLHFENYYYLRKIEIYGLYYFQQGLLGGLAQWLVSRTTDQGVPGSRPGPGTVCCGLEQVTFTHCLVLVKPRKPWTDDSD